MIKYSEIFHSFQGEGKYTGAPSAWLRFFGCNLECPGFGQKDPTDESTYELPYKDFDPSTVQRMEDLPVWKFGCDSSYSWAAKFKHLAHSGTADEIAQRLMDVTQSHTNPVGAFQNPITGQETHLVFTGGEPMLSKHQRNIVEIVTALTMRGNAPKNITIETNGTKPLTDEFIAFFGDSNKWQGELFFSCSPKLFTVSGERSERAIQPHVIRGYTELTNAGQLKFVVGTEERQWDELKAHLAAFREAGVIYPVTIMPVGARDEEQQKVAAEVSNRAMDEGFYVSARVHVYVYGNVIGS